MTGTWLTPREAAHRAGDVRTETLKRWERTKGLVCQRTAGNRRRYSKESLDAILVAEYGYVPGAWSSA